MSRAVENEGSLTTTDVELRRPELAGGSSTFPKLERLSDGGWSIRVDDVLSTGPADRRHLFGGSALALAIMAMEADSNRPAQWASVHFYASVAVSSILQLRSTTEARGRQFDQMVIQGNVEGRSVLHGIGTFGRAAGEEAVQFPSMPAVTPPEDCPLFVAHRDADTDVHSTLEIRPAAGRFGIFSRAQPSTDGRVLAWMRHRQRTNDRVALAFMSDFLPAISGNALGLRSGGSSFDNNIRYCHECESDWILCEFAIEAVQAGVGHGISRLYSTDGRLLAIASQSFKLRVI